MNVPPHTNAFRCVFGGQPGLGLELALQLGLLLKVVSERVARYKQNTGKVLKVEDCSPTLWNTIVKQERKGTKRKACVRRPLPNMRNRERKESGLLNLTQTDKLMIGCGTSS